MEDDQMKCHCFFCKAFFGKFQSTLTCHMCQHTSRTEQTLLELSLDVQLHSKKRPMNGTSTPTLAKCLQSWVSPEELIMDGYQCQGCHGYPDKLTKQLRIKRLPAMLCMQMKVFYIRHIHGKAQS
jgi:ubiquitin carboxyl-terminal hydrolase 22/27/51